MSVVKMLGKKFKLITTQKGLYQMQSRIRYRPFLCFKQTTMWRKNICSLSVDKHRTDGIYNLVAYFGIHHELILVALLALEKINDSNRQEYDKKKVEEERVTLLTNVDVCISVSK